MNNTEGSSKPKTNYKWG